MANGRLETHESVILPHPTPRQPMSGGESVGKNAEKFASLYVLNDTSVLIAILRKMDLGWSCQVVDY